MRSGKFPSPFLVEAPRGPGNLCEGSILFFLFALLDLTCCTPSTCLVRTKLLLEWDASPVNDMLADSMVALAAQAQTRYISY